MKVRVLAVGNRMPKWVSEAYCEYAKRLPKAYRPELLELAPAKAGKQPPEQLMAIEQERLLAQVSPADQVIALERSGEQWSTLELAQRLEQWQQHGRNTIIMIGGAEGLGPACLQRADHCWSLSKLTMPHPLVRVVLIEQLYRAWSCSQGHPYHR